MALDKIFRGTTPDDGTGDSLYLAAEKINAAIDAIIALQDEAGLYLYVAYTAGGEITAISNAEITFAAGQFRYPAGTTTFTFTDGTTDMVATFDMTWSFDVDAIDVAYDAGTFTVTNIQPSTITHDSVGNKFVAPTGTTAFTFDLDGVEVEAEYDTVEAEDWAFLLHLASTDGNTAQDWKITKPVGTLKIHWGDGNTATQTSTSHTTNTNTYAEAAPEGEPYRIRLSGNWLDISRIEIANNALTGDADKFSIFRNLTSQFYISGNNFTGSINRWSLIGDGAGTGWMWGHGNPGMTGDIGNLAEALTERQQIFLFGSTASGGWMSLHGDVSKFRFNTSLRLRLQLQRNQNNGFTFESTAPWKRSDDGVTPEINLSFCNLSSEHIDNALIAFAGDETNFVEDCTITLAGNGTRTSASDAAIALINDPARNNTLDIT